jgi:hypothetical protein
MRHTEGPSSNDDICNNLLCHSYHDHSEMHSRCFVALVKQIKTIKAYFTINVNSHVKLCRTVPCCGRHALLCLKESPPYRHGYGRNTNLAMVLNVVFVKIKTLPEPEFVNV